MAGRVLRRGLLPAWMAIAVIGVLLLGSLALLPRLQINNELIGYFPDDAAAVAAERHARELFPQDQVLVALFQGPELFEGAFLGRLDAVADRLAAHPAVERILGLTRVDHIAGSEDGFVVEPLVDAARLQASRADELRQRVAADRFAPRLLASPSGDAIALVVRPVPLHDSFARLELLEATEAAIREAGIGPQLRALAGHVALDVAQLRSMTRDSEVFIPVTVGLGLVLLWVLFRRWLAVGVLMLTIVSAVLPAVALIALWGRPYTLVASITPPLLAALATAMLMHLFAALAHASRRGQAGRERVVAALDAIARPTLYAALTTAAGLLSLGLSPIQPIQTFGVAAAFGVLVLYGVVIHLLPSLLVVCDRAPWPTGEGVLRWIDAVVGAAARLAIRRAGWVLGLTVLVFAALTPALFEVRTETDLYQYFHEDHPLTRSTRQIEQALAGVSTIEVVFRAGGRDALKEPARLHGLRDFQAWLASQPEVDRTLSMTDIIEEMNWAFHGEDPAYRVVPERRELISQYLFIYDGRDLYELVDRELRTTRITVNLNVHGASAIRAVIERIGHRLQEVPIDGLDAEVAGLGRLFADQERLLVQGQVSSLWAALGLIFVMMLVQWRSVRGAAVCMVPNVMPVAAIFMLMGIAGIWLDMATAMIASVVAGIAIDDTIHLYQGYRQRVAAGRGAVLALMRSYQHAGRAIVATTCVLCAQFFLLYASEFVPTARFGVLAGSGLLAALGFDLLFLPALLLVLGRLRRFRG